MCILMSIVMCFSKIKRCICWLVNCTCILCPIIHIFLNCAVYEVIKKNGRVRQATDDKHNKAPAL